jgi:hypothetical protein
MESGQLARLADDHLFDAAKFLDDADFAGRLATTDPALAAAIKAAGEAAAQWFRAAEKIRAIVSGFPGDRGRLRELLMLQAYVDGAGTGDPKFLVLAGYIATSNVWAEFSTAWDRRLTDAHMPFFKMHKWANQPEIAGWFYHTLEEFDIKAAIARIVNTAELVEVEKSIIYPSNITNKNFAYNQYYFGFKYITRIVAERQNDLNLLEPIDFIFDDESEKVKIPAAWDALKRMAPKKISDMMGPIFRNDVKTMPLQAADLYAWWILKWVREKVENWSVDLPFPWEKKKDIQSLTAYFGRRSFLFDISKFLEGLARTSDELEYTKSLMPEEWQASSIIPRIF